MNGHKKRFSTGWVVGVALGLGSSAALVYGVTVPNAFTDGSTASAAAVNANFNALKAAIDSLEGSGACTGNNASDEMVRVGTSCVDKNPAALFSSRAADATAITAIPAGCNANGTGCTTIFAQSRATPGTALKGGDTISWARAATACANAGKRLATAREIVTAVTTGALTLANNATLWADAPSATAGGTLGGTHVEHTTGGNFSLFGTTTPYTQTDAGWTAVNFRCAR